MPHRLNSDDVYRGYDLPDGAMVIPNIWFVVFLFHTQYVTLMFATLQVDDPEP